MTINHSNQPASGQTLQAPGRASQSSVLLASQAVNPQQASQQLARLKRELGDTVSAKILSIEQKSTDQKAAATPQRHHQSSRQSPDPDSAKHSAAERTNKQSPEAPAAKPAVARVWQIALQVAGLTRPLTAEFSAHTLPAQVQPGQALTLRIDPQTGLRFGPAGEPKASSSIDSLMQALSRFVPIQDHLKNQLGPLLALALKNGQIPNAPPHSSSGDAANSILLRSLTGDRSPTLLPSTKALNAGLSAPLRALAEQWWQRLSSKATHEHAVNKAASSALNPLEYKAGKTDAADLAHRQESLSPLIKSLLKGFVNSTLTPSQSINPELLKAGLGRSGIAMEAKLLANPEATRSLAKDIRAWLNQLPADRALADQRPPGESPLLKAVPGDLKALLLTALVVSQHHSGANSLHGPGAGQQALPANWETLINWLMPRLSNNGSGGHPLLFPGNSKHNSLPTLRAESMEAGELLRVLAQTLARIQVNQLNALQMNAGSSGETGSTQYWFMELPILGQQLDTVQIRLEKEPSKSQKTKQKHQWRLILAFDFDQLGPLQSHVLYTNGTVSATFWADQTKTLQLINAELPSLRKGLKDWGIVVGDLTVRRGNPPSPENPVSHRLLDEKA